MTVAELIAKLVEYCNANKLDGGTDTEVVILLGRCEEIPITEVGCVLDVQTGEFSFEIRGER